MDHVCNVYGSLVLISSWRGTDVLRVRKIPPGVIKIHWRVSWSLVSDISE